MTDTPILSPRWTRDPVTIAVQSPDLEQASLMQSYLAILGMLQWTISRTRIDN